MLGIPMARFSGSVPVSIGLIVSFRLVKLFKAAVLLCECLKSVSFSVAEAGNSQQREILHWRAILRGNFQVRQWLVHLQSSFIHKSLASICVRDLR